MVPFFAVYISTLFDKWAGLFTATMFTLWYRSEYYVPPRKSVKDNATQTEVVRKTEESTRERESEAGSDAEEKKLLMSYFSVTHKLDT